MNTNEVMTDRPVIVEETDPRLVVDVMVHGKEMPVPEPGAYVWELFHEGTVLGASRVWVRRKGEDES